MDGEVLVEEVRKVLSELGYKPKKDSYGDYIEVNGEKVYFDVRYYSRGYGVALQCIDCKFNTYKRVYITGDFKRKVKKALTEISKTIEKEKEIKKKLEEEIKKRREDIKKRLKENMELVAVSKYSFIIRVCNIRVTINRAFNGEYYAYADREDMMKNPLDKQKIIENIKDVGFSGSITFEKDKITDISLRDEKSLDDILEKLSQILS